MLSHQPTLSGCVGVVAGDVVRGVERVADEHGVRFRRVQPAVGFVDQVVGVERRAALEVQRLVEMHGSAA